jgi:hypothetical protein
MPIVPGEPAPIAGQGFELVFEDDFDTLDTSVWQPEPWNETHIDPSRINVADSIITFEWIPNASAPWQDYTRLASVGPSSPTYPYRPDAKAWQEGYFEVRARCTNDPWAKLAIWFMSLETANRYPDIFDRDCSRLNGEWDMVENGIRNSVETGGYANVNHVSPIHRNTSHQQLPPCGIPDIDRSYQWDGSNLCDWHVWGGLWTGSDVSTFLDGVYLGSQTTFDTTAQPMYMLLECKRTNSAPIGGEPEPSTLETQVDWVRVWQRPPSARRCVASFPGTAGSHIAAADAPGLQVDGDLDIRMIIEPADETPASNQVLMSKWHTSPAQESWQIIHTTTGQWSFGWRNSSTGLNRFEASDPGFVLPGLGAYT